MKSLFRLLLPQRGQNVLLDADPGGPFDVVGQLEGLNGAIAGLMRTRHSAVNTLFNVPFVMRSIAGELAAVLREFALAMFLLGVTFEIAGSKTLVTAGDRTRDLPVRTFIAALVASQDGARGRKGAAEVGVATREFEVGLGDDSLHGEVTPRGRIVHVPARGTGNHARFFFALAADDVTVTALVDVRVSPDLDADGTLGDGLEQRGGRSVLDEAVHSFVVV